MSYELIWENGGLIFSYSGIVTNEDAIQSNKQYYNNSLSDDLKYQIVDFTNADKITIDEETVVTIAALDKGQSHSMSDNQKIAFVGNHDNLDIVFNTYSTVLASLDSGWFVAYFYDIDSAREWVS